MTTWFTIAYRQYGQWSLTMPFETRAQAEKHAKTYLESDEFVVVVDGVIFVKNTREHVTDITYLEVELPE